MEINLRKIIEESDIDFSDFTDSHIETIASLMYNSAEKAIDMCAHTWQISDTDSQYTEILKCKDKIIL
jgi:hypothetical protein